MNGRLHACLQLDMFVCLLNASWRFFFSLLTLSLPCIFCQSTWALIYDLHSLVGTRNHHHHQQQHCASTSSHLFSNSVSANYRASWKWLNARMHIHHHCWTDLFMMPSAARVSFFLFFFFVLPKSPARSFCFSSLIDPVLSEHEATLAAVFSVTKCLITWSECESRDVNVLFDTVILSPNKTYCFVFANMPRIKCAVVGCKFNNVNSQGRVSFYKFPNDPEQRKVWTMFAEQQK